MGLSLNLILGVPNLLLGYVYLLGNLHKNDKGVMKINAYMNEHMA